MSSQRQPAPREDTYPDLGSAPGGIRIAGRGRRLVPRSTKHLETWIGTLQGGPGAPDDLELGHATQAWLAASDHPEAAGSGGYWYHQRRHAPAPAAAGERFQDALLGELTGLTGVRLP